MLSKDFSIDIGYPWSKTFTVTNDEDGSAVPLDQDTIRFVYGDTTLEVGSGLTVTGNQIEVAIADTSDILPGPSMKYTFYRSIGVNPVRAVMTGYLHGNEVFDV